MTDPCPRLTATDPFLIESLRDLAEGYGGRGVAEVASLLASAPGQRWTQRQQERRDLVARMLSLGADDGTVPSASDVERVMAIVAAIETADAEPKDAEAVKAAPATEGF